jgi:hypothetical protein
MALLFILMAKNLKIAIIWHASSILNFLHFSRLLKNHWTNMKQSCLEWSLGDPLKIESDRSELHTRWSPF